MLTFKTAQLSLTYLRYRLLQFHLIQPHRCPPPARPNLTVADSYAPNSQTKELINKRERLKINVYASSGKIEF